MSGHKKVPSDLPRSASARRQPVFSSARFERALSVSAGSTRASAVAYSTDEVIARLLNQAPLQPERLASQRHSSVSDNLSKELALAEASFNPTDLLREGLDEWHDKSLSIQLLKRSQSASATRQRILRNPSRTSARFPEGLPPRPEDFRGFNRSHRTLSQKQDDSSRIFPQPLSQSLSQHQQFPPADAALGTRHRYNFDYGIAEEDLGLDGLPLDLPKEYARVLAAAPPATLIHLVKLYHQALVKNGNQQEAQKISDHLSALEAADMEEMALEVSGIDLLLRDGLLKYLMSIQPYIPSIPSQILTFKDVTYTTTVQLDAGYESIYTKGLATIKGPFNKSPLERVTLLRDVTGYLMPGTLTLIIGTPGSGTSVIQNVLAGRGNLPGSTTVGTIKYNGQSVNAVKCRRLVSLVGPNDVHYPQLTVRETVEFARECSQYYKSEHFPVELKELVIDVLKAGQDPKLETNLSMLGLKRVAGRPVGSPMRPSITEAERHRLSVSEMIAGTYAVYMFDQLNKGLDNTVTFDLVTSIRIFTRVRTTTVAATLIQPSQDVFDLFDRVILLDRNHIVYQGPRQDALPYFENLGYVKPRQLSVPEFLEEITTSDGTQFLKPGCTRLTHDDFVAAYKNSDTYKDVLRVVNNPEVVAEVWVQGPQPLGVNFVQSPPNNELGMMGPKTSLVSSMNEKGGSLVEVSMNHTRVLERGDEVVAVGGSTGMLNYLKVGGQAKEEISLFDQSQETVRLQLERPHQEDKEYNKQFSHDYVLDPWSEFKLLLKRDLTATWRNKIFLGVRAFQILVLGFYLGFVFFRVHPDFDQLNMNLLRSVFFVSLLDMTLFNLGQMSLLFEERLIFYKQNGSHFYRPSTYVLAKFVGSVPFSLAEATTWTLIVYFLSNLSVNQGGWHFWVFYIVISLTVLNGAAMVRFLCALCPDMIAANAILGVIVAVFVSFAGFLIPRWQVRHYWIWAYYLDPLQWGITSLVINEFTSPRYQTLCKDIPASANLPQCTQFPGRANQTVGHAFLARGQFYIGRQWIGIGIAIMTCWLILWNLLTLLAFQKVRHIPRTVITPSAEAKYLRKTSVVMRDVEGQGSLLNLSINAIPVTLSWHELSYDVLIPSIGRTVTLLNYVSGWAEPGEMVALLGASGAGKTTLLNCLAGRGVNFGRIGGQILVNGFPKVQGAFTKIAGYMDRLEAYSPYMTVREAIAFNCDLQLAKTATLEKRKSFVEEILDLMELRNVQDTLVKSLGSSYLTLADANRLRIGTELARNPSVFFLDTPTKNLDTRSALQLVRDLRRITDTGRTVICTLSLPSQRLLTCFTSVQILKRGGETVYWGPVGSEGELIKAYFEAIPGTPRCPPNTSVTTYAVDVIGDGVVDRKALKDYAFEYRVNELALHNHIQLQRLRRAKGTLGLQITDTGFGSSYLTRAINILKKLQLFHWRNVNYSWGRMFSSFLTALILGSIYFQQETTNTAGMNTKLGAIFISSVLLPLSNAQAVIPQVLQNRIGFEREKSTRQFNLVLYMVSWTLGEIPYLVVSTLIYASIFCGMSGTAVGSGAHFFKYWVILFELTLGITFFGMFLASASVLPQIAGTMVTIFIGFWVATSGAVIPKKKLLPQFLWMYWSNPLQYAISAQTSLSFFCDVEKPTCLNGGLNLACARNSTACLQCDCQRLDDSGNAFVWTTVKNLRNVHHDSIPYQILALLGFIIVFRLATFAVWRYKK